MPASLIDPNKLQNKGQKQAVQTTEAYQHSDIDPLIFIPNVCSKNWSIAREVEPMYLPTATQYEWTSEQASKEPHSSNKNLLTQPHWSIDFHNETYVRKIDRSDICSTEALLEHPSSYRFSYLPYYLSTYLSIHLPAHNDQARPNTRTSNRRECS